jgi:hypothetical protein
MSEKPKSDTQKSENPKSENTNYKNVLFSNIGEKTKRQHLDNLLKEQSFVKFDPYCIRNKSNISKLSNLYKFDNELFSKEDLLENIPIISPKLKDLLDNIENLDKIDMQNKGKVFKHFIFSDLANGSAGAKLLASAMIAKGYTLGYTAKPIEDTIKVSPKLKKITTPLDNSSKYKTKSDLTISQSSPSSAKTSIESESDDESSDEESPTNKKKYEKIILKSEEELKKTDNNFFLLSSNSVYYQNITVELKKNILTLFNKRPENSYGNLARFIIMDSGYKEGIDLFDVKYVHIFEPSLVHADQKQVIGRGTRTCGQKGLDFHPTQGWPLHVFIYDLEFPDNIRRQFMDSHTGIELYMKSMNMNFQMYTFSNNLEKIAMFGAVDYELNKNIHTFSVDPLLKNDFSETTFNFNDARRKPPQLAITNGLGSEVTTEGILSQGISEPSMNFKEMRDYVKANFSTYSWDKVEMKNLCISDEGVKDDEGNSRAVIKYTPTQDFIRNFFTPASPIKGMLLYHSVGTGKTCTAIATATSSFEKEGYTVLWVTRTTLKSDIWKNMFDMVCNDNIRDRIINTGLRIPKEMKDRMKLISKSWRIRPMSYKQFSNLIMKRNDYYKKLTAINGFEDPLRRTLVIIDEAHKLYGGEDLSTIERPNMEEFHKAIMNSYDKSGTNSVKLLLMTATPITNNPMELIKLINLCKLPTQQLPDVFDSFSSIYLNTTGEFTYKGSATFLDQITGNISYLNREKDARQFAQPILHRVNTPIVDDMDIVNQFDSKYVRKYMESDMIPLKNELTSKLKELEKYDKINKNSFTELKNKCKEYENEPTKKKACTRIVNRNIRLLLDELKSEILPIKNKIKELREEFKNTNIFKTTLLKNVKDNIVNNRDKFIQYKSSAYYTMANECGKTIKTEKEILQILNDLPEVKQMNQNIEENKYNMGMLKLKMKTLLRNHRAYIKSVKGMIYSNENGEDKTLQSTIKNEKRLFKKTSNTMQGELDGYSRKIRETKKNMRQTIGALNKTATKMLREETKIEMQIAKAENKTQKALRKQEGYIEDLKDDDLVRLNSKYMNLAEDEVQEKMQEMNNKTRKNRRSSL